VEGARRAGPDDLARLGQLADEARDEQQEARGGRLFFLREVRPRPAGEWLAAALEDDDQLVLAGTIEASPGEAAVVGYAVVRAELLRDGSRLALLEELYVEPHARSVGVGESLMDEALRWAGAAGCSGIDAWALPGNRATKNFFESFGLVARAILVHRVIPPPEPAG
jgi:GNAT superfamily N-acetyltransferase